MKIKNLRRLKAFTLVELIVVITILAILWTIAFLSLQWYSKNARDWVRTSDMDSMKSNLWIYGVQKWVYPDPDNQVLITHAWWTVWSQWTVWDNMTRNLGKLSKKPLDPLYQNEYSYSITSWKTEYEMWTIYEWESLARLNKNLLLTKANAADWLVAKLVWNYNEKMVLMSSWAISYILATPSILSTVNTWTTLVNVLNGKTLVFNKFWNIPWSYAWKIWIMTWSFDYGNWNLVEVFSGSLDSLLTNNNTKKALIISLQKAYSGTIIGQKAVYSDIVKWDVNDINVTTALANDLMKWSLWVATTVTKSTTSAVCWSSDGWSWTTSPSTWLCSVWTASSVTWSWPWNWTCTASDWTASCSQSQSMITINCTWLPSNSVYYNNGTSYSFSALPSTSATATYNASPTVNTCQYTCASGNTWNWSICSSWDSTLTEYNSLSVQNTVAACTSYISPSTFSSILNRRMYYTLPNWVIVKFERNSNKQLNVQLDLFC